MTEDDDIFGDDGDEAPVTDLGGWEVTRKPVSITWLMNAFRMDRQTIKRRLATLTPAGVGPRNSPAYDFVEAASYLVTPRFDVEQALRTMRSQDLPVHLQQQFWAGQRQRQIFDENAKDLWRTKDVFEVLMDLMTTLRGRIQLFVVEVEGAHHIDEKVRKTIVQLSDELQKSIYDDLLEMAAKKRTRAHIKEYDDVAGTPVDDV